VSAQPARVARAWEPMAPRALLRPEVAPQALLRLAVAAPQVAATPGRPAARVEPAVARVLLESRARRGPEFQGASAVGQTPVARRDAAAPGAFRPQERPAKPVERRALASEIHPLTERQAPEVQRAAAEMMAAAAQREQGRLAPAEPRDAAAWQASEALVVPAATWERAALQQALGRPASGWRASVRCRSSPVPVSAHRA